MTELSRQLKGLQTFYEPGPSSFLFDLKTAARIDKDVVFTLGLNGLEELRSEDDRFAMFYTELFEENFAFQNCYVESLDKAQAEHIREELLKLTSLIAPHFLKPGCHKVLEFLIRFYKVHIVIKHDLLLFLLPFHSTKFYIRLLMICELDSFWHFLSNHQATGFILRRSDIIKQCTYELGLLKGIIEKSEVSSTHLRFACAVVLELIQTVKLSEFLMQIIIVFVNKLISQDREHKDFAISIIIHTATKHNFSPQYLQGILTDLLTTTGEEKLNETIATNLLINIHKTKSLPNSLLKVIASDKIAGCIVEASKSMDVYPIINIAASKFFNSVIKNGSAQGIFSICRDANLSAKSLPPIVHALFLQFLNIEKSKIAEISPVFYSILSVLWQKYSDELLEIVPSIIPEISSTENKQKLYDLISKASSGMPFDTKSDLPLVLALSNLSPEIRLHAVLQITDPQPYLSTLKTLVQNEEVPEILLAVLDLELTEDFTEILMVKYKKLLSHASPNTDCLRKLFASLTKTAFYSADYIKTLLLAFDNAILKDLSSQALAKCKSHKLLEDFKGKGLSLYLKRKFIKDWKQLYKDFIDLIDCPLVFSLIPEVIEKVSQKPENFEGLIWYSGQLINWSISKDVLDYQFLETIIRKMPALSTLDGPLEVCCNQMLKSLLKFLIPKNPQLCKEILAKNYQNKTLQVLCELSENSPEALHLAACVSYHSKNPESVFFTLPYVLLNLSRDQNSRSSAVIVIEQYLNRSLPVIQIEYNIDVNDQIARFIEKSKEIKKFLKKIVKFKAGILQDENFIVHALGKISKGAVDDFIAEGLSFLAYGRIKYLQIIAHVHKNSLTDLLVPVARTNVEKLEIIKRLEKYSSWENFPHTEFVMDCLRQKDLFENCLKLITPQRFKQINKTYEIFCILLDNIHQHSAAVHEALEGLGVPESILADALENFEDKTEEILQIFQYSPQSSVLLRALMEKLKKINCLDQTEYFESLKQMVLVTIRIQGAQVKVDQEFLNEILKSLASSSSIETKKNAITTLCSFDEQNKEQVLEMLENSVSQVSSIEEYNFYKIVLRKFSNFDIARIVRSLVVYSQIARLGLKEACQIVKTLGSSYLYILIQVYLSEGYQELFQVCNEFSVIDVITAFNLLLASKTRVYSFMSFTFSQKLFIEKLVKIQKTAAENLSETFRLIFLNVAEINKSKKNSTENGKTSEKKKVKLEIKELLNTFNDSINDTMFSISFSVLLQENTYFSSREALEFILPHVEKSSRAYFPLINPLCSILENNVKKIPNLHKEKYQRIAVYFQMILSILFVLFKNYKENTQFLSIYGKSILSYSNSAKAEIKSASCLCFSTFFNKKQIETLPFIDPFIEEIFNLCSNTEEIIRKCGLKCLKTLIKSSEELLNPHILKILQISCFLNNESLFRIVSKHLPFRILIEKLNIFITSLDPSSDLSSIDSLFKLLVFLTSKNLSSDLQVLHTQVFTFYKSSLELISNQKISNIHSLSLKLGESFSKLALNFNNSLLKPGLLDLFNWSIEKTETGSYNFSKLLSFICVLYHLTLELKHLFVPYYSHFFELFLDLAKEFNSCFSTEKRKRNKCKALRVLNSQVLSCLLLLPKYDSERNLSFEKYERISEALSEQFKCVYVKNYSVHCEKNLIPAVLSFLTCHDYSVRQSFTVKILLQTRSKFSEVRLNSLSCINRALNEIGKEYAAFIGDIMPFVLEGLEDTDDSVTCVARSIYSQLESFCGEEIKNYLG